MQTICIGILFHCLRLPVSPGSVLEGVLGSIRHAAGSVCMPPSHLSPPYPNPLPTDQ
jgi:hypothetical protein